MKPLFMWAGGKSKMIKHYTPHFPSKFDTYIEPFFGGGALFIQAFKMNPNADFVINDVNSGIVNVYTSIRDHLSDFKSKIDDLERRYLSLDKQNRKDFYYELREQHAYRYDEWSKVEEAAVLYFLMKTGFNGIWQINKNTNDRFGTPCGLLNEKDSVYDKDNLIEWHNALQNVTILNGDYRETLDHVKLNTWLFMDPPYRGGHTKYGTDFDDVAQKNAVVFAHNAMMLGATSWLTNRDLEDDFFESFIKEMNYKSQIYKFDVTYTAGRRKKTQDGFEAKKAKELLITF